MTQHEHVYSTYTILSRLQTNISFIELKINVMKITKNMQNEVHEVEVPVI